MEEYNLVSLIRTNQKVFAILGTSDGTAHLAQKLTDYGMGEVQLYVGENLSYEDEKIFVKQARELTDYRVRCFECDLCLELDAKTALTLVTETFLPVPKKRRHDTGSVQCLGGSQRAGDAGHPYAGAVRAGAGAGAVVAGPCGSRPGSLPGTCQSSPTRTGDGTTVQLRRGCVVI